MHLETERSSKLRDQLGVCDWGGVEMHLEADIEWNQRWTWQLCLSESGDALGGRNQANSEMHLDAVIQCIGKYTWTPWLMNIGGVLGGGWSGGNWSGDNWSGGNRFEGNCSAGGQPERSQSGAREFGYSESWPGRSGGMCDGSWDSIYWLTRDCGNVQNWAQ